MDISRRKLCKILFFLIFNLSLFFPGNFVYPQSYHVRTYVEDDGLANSKVLDLTQDKSGRMWFATRNGISVYDGTRWETHSHNRELPVGEYSKIKCDSRGMIWVFRPFSNSTAYFDGRKWRLLPIPEFSLVGEFINSFELFETGDIRVIALGAKSSGLYLWTHTNEDTDTAGKWRNIDTRNGLISSSINDLAAFDKGFYAASDKGLSVLTISPGIGINIDNTINKSLNLPSPEIFAIAMEKKNKALSWSTENTILWLLGKEWIGYLEDGVFKMFTHSLGIRRDDTFGSFLQPDDRGGVFCGNRYGICYVDKRRGSVKHFGEEQGLIAGGATAIYIDRERNIWFSSLRGVSKISGMRFANYRKLHGLLSDETTAVWEIEPGSMVFGHNNGITFFKGNRFYRRVLSRPDIGKNLYSRVLDIRGDDKGNVWVAASDLGFAKINKENIIRWYDAKAGLTGQATSVLMDKSGNLWAATATGIFLLQGDAFIKKGPNHDTDTYIRRLFPGPGNETSIYAATSTEGIYYLNPETDEWTTYWRSNNSAANNVFALLFDSQGKIWVGTRDGLYWGNVHKKYTLMKYNMGEFRIKRPVYFIIEDHKNRLWFGTENGVIRWNGKNWKEYTVQQGLSGRETNRAAGYVDHRGRVWIGTDRGLSCYREEFEKEDIQPPMVELVSLEVSGKQMPLQTVNRLKHHMNNLVFNFRVVSFIDEDANRFQCKLGGFDKDWSAESVPNYGQVRYTNLPPGRYIFHLRAKNAEGLWSRAVSSARIVIQRPFWQDWWFYLLAILIFGLSVYSTHVYLSKKRYASLLEEQVHEKTEELRKYQQHLQEMVEKRTAELTAANDLLKKEIKKRKQTRKIMVEQQNRLKTIFNATPDLMVLMDRDFVYRAVNPAFCQFIGKKEDELVGKTDFEVFSPDEAEIYRQNDIEVMKSGKLNIIERCVEDAGETQKWLQVAKSPIFDINGKPEGMLVSVRDITKLKEAEAKIETSLKEKEVLLREIHHRVKNNLQIISSLLNLQAGYVEDRQSLKLFKNSQERVLAMALIHEKLYESGDLSRIDFQDYIRSLVSYLFDSYSLNSEQVRLELHIGNMELNIETAIPLGLIVNELVSNSLKHAFPRNRKGNIRVTLEEFEDEENRYDYVLVIGDNGIGFPGVIDFRSSDSLGMVLVDSLVTKLRGVIALEKTEGTKFTIKFKKLAPLEKPGKRY